MLESKNKVYRVLKHLLVFTIILFIFSCTTISYAEINNTTRPAEDKLEKTTKLIQPANENIDIPIVKQAEETELVNKIIGEGVTVSNVKIMGVPTQFGVFDGANSIFGFNDGIVLTTGDITNMFTTYSNTLSKPYGTPGDTDLDKLAVGGVTNDAAIIEFDTVSTTNKLSFQYVFASEEFNQPAKYNDVFGLYINGENIAYIPNSTTAVSIQTLKDTEYHIENTSRNDFAFLGYSTILNCEADVVAGETIHVKIAIADISDSGVDSAVFIKGGSLVYSAAQTEKVEEPKTGDGGYINYIYYGIAVVVILLVLFAIIKVRPFLLK